VTAKLHAHAWNARGRPDGDVSLCGALTAGERCAAAGITTLTKLVARARDQATQRLFSTLPRYRTQAPASASSCI
jgi:hypothetical protein